MSTRTVRINFTYNGALTDATSAVLADKTDTYGVKRNDTNAVVVAANTAMNHVSTGQYDYSFTEPVTGLAYTAWIKFVYGGNTYYEEVDLVAVAVPTPSLACDYASLVNDLGYHLFGLRPTTIDVITDGVASAYQSGDILRCIAKGLQFVYSAYRWSFLRPLVSITTYPAYTTGTITVDASGNVTGIGTTFPTYSASAGGCLNIPNVGSYAVATYTSGSALVLANYTDAAVTTATGYSIGFDSYALPTGVDSLEGQLTYPQSSNGHREKLARVSEVEIRRMLAHHNRPGAPRFYAETTTTFDPTVGSSRYVTFYPVPDLQYILTAVGTLRPGMIDATNKYPLGVEVLAPCIAESCLAAAEREIEQKDASNPDAVHNRALLPLLQMAIQRDKEYAAPDTLGVDHGSEDNEQRHVHPRMGGIYWDAGGYTGWL